MHLSNKSGKISHVDERLNHALILEMSVMNRSQEMCEDPHGKALVFESTARDECQN